MKTGPKPTPKPQGRFQVTTTDLSWLLAANDAHTAGRHEGTNEFIKLCPMCCQERNAIEMALS